jgi:pimeloyl-ACP methyl ester carboxylesterase
MLNYEVHGTGEQTIILLHGLAQTHKAFDEQLELADEYKLITLDLRGHGDSITDRYITLEQMAIDVLELMDHLNIEQAAICGVSLGGLVVQEIYNLAPSRAKSLILSNTYSYVPQVFLQMEIASRKDKLDSVTDEEYIEGIARKCSLSQETEAINKIIHTIKLNRGTYIPCASAPLGKDYSSIIRKIDVPTLIISGWFDLVTPYILQLQQSMMIKGSKHIQFRSGHLPNLECSKEFNKVVREFMREVN